MGKEYRTESAKMLAVLLHGMQGTPYIYQGEELGMTNVKFPIGEYRDLETLNMYQERLSKGYQESDIMAVSEEQAQNYDNTLEKLERKYQPSQDEFYIMSHSFIEE